MIEPLRTPRLVIRRFAPADLGDFLAYQADPRVREHMQGKPMDAVQAADYLAVQSIVEEHKPNTWHGYAVEHANTGTVIGDIGVYLDAAVPGSGDVGFQFHPAYHRQGYGLEAATAFLSYVFTTLDLDRVTAGCAPANQASAGLLERLGMRRRPEPAADGSNLYDLSRAGWPASR